MDWRCWQEFGVVIWRSDAIDRTVETLHVVQELAELTDPHQPTAIRQIGLALHNYYEAHKSLPPQSLTDDKGQRLLSWRVLILPYLDQTALYNEFHLDEPWDSPHNLKLAETIPEPYHQPTRANKGGPQKTQIVAVLTENSAFGRPGKPVTFVDVRDGLSNTVWFVEAEPSKAIVWTKPEDLVVD